MFSMQGTEQASSISVFLSAANERFYGPWYRSKRPVEHMAFASDLFLPVVSHYPLKLCFGCSFDVFRSRDGSPRYSSRR